MKQALIGVAGGLVSGLIALAVLFNGPLSPSTEAAAPGEVVVATLESAPPASEKPAEPEPAVTEEEPVLCSVSELEDAENILDLQAQVIDAETGQILFDRASGTPARAASVQKLFTAAAALETLGPGHRVTTRVYVDSEDPSILYLVGAGDVTLSRAGLNQTSVYKNAPKLSQLVAQIDRKSVV